MAPKRKPERKTGIHYLNGPPNKKAKTTQTAPRVTGLHTLAGNAESRAQSRKATPENKVHTWVNVSLDRSSTKSSNVKRFYNTDHDVNDDHDYVENGSTSDDDGNLCPGSLSGVRVTSDGSQTRDAGEHQTTVVDRATGTRSQTKAAIRHEEATRAKFMFLDRLSRSTEQTLQQDEEAGDNGADEVGKECAPKS